MLVKQQKTTTKPPFDPKPYQVKEVRGTQITVVRGKQQKVRSKEKVKLLRDRFKHLQGGSTEVHNQEKRMEELNEEDETLVSVKSEISLESERQILDRGSLLHVKSPLY